MKIAKIFKLLSFFIKLGTINRVQRKLLPCNNCILLPVIDKYSTCRCEKFKEHLNYFFKMYNIIDGNLWTYSLFNNLDKYTLFLSRIELHTGRIPTLKHIWRTINGARTKEQKSKRSKERS
jgi:hypothetical protein